MRKKMSVFRKVSGFIMMMVVLCHLSVFAQNGPIITATPSGPVCIGDQVTLSVSCPDEGALIFSEGFSDITDGNDNINTGSPDKYQCTLPNFPDCDNEHVFLAGGHLRFGDMRSGGGGYITSAPMDLSAGPFKVKLWLRGWYSTREQPEYYLLVDADTVQNHVPIPRLPFTAQYVEFTYTSTTAATNHSTITIGNSDTLQRFFLDSVAVVYVPATQYMWSTGESSSTITVSPTESSNYTVSVSNSYGCQGSASYSLTVTDCENVNCEKWFRVNNINQLSVGDKIIIVTHNLSDGHYHALAQQHPGADYMDTCWVVKQDTALSNIDHAQKLTLTNINPYVFQTESGNYLSYPGSGNKLIETNTLSSESSWFITIGNDSVAKINNQEYDSYFIQYNAAAPRFSCYRNTQQDVELYKLHFINPHTVTFNPGNGTSEVTELTEDDCQAGIVLPTAFPCAQEFIFAGWTTQSINTSITTAPNPLYAAGSLYNPIIDQTLYAVYKKCSSSEQAFVKVMSDTSNWNGDYLIVYEDGNLAFNGGLTTLDVVGNTISVPINNNTIASNATTNAAKFTISSYNNNWTIKSASNYYIGRTSNTNGLNTDQTTPFGNTLSYNSGSIDIVSDGGAYLRYNSNNGQERFRFFKSSTYTNQEAIQLFRYELIEECEYTSFPFYPSNSTIETACDTYTWLRSDGTDTTIIGSGRYLFQYTEGGCVYVDTLHMTINHPVTIDT